eukprot:TRINITY_DN8301_c0_g1_i9.p1 TRINITY_DN8301_c0_g1~~TRINITY_DN8301_c0_g1_i9.p1  ORF type:complete len:283 (+),score=48.41 TRINITY_DN8301_c0_g1_i9:110-958(+)
MAKVVEAVLREAVCYLVKYSDSTTEWIPASDDSAEFQKALSAYREAAVSSPSGPSTPQMKSRQKLTATRSRLNTIHREMMDGHHLSSSNPPASAPSSPVKPLDLTPGRRSTRSQSHAASPSSTMETDLTLSQSGRSTRSAGKRAAAAAAAAASESHSSGKKPRNVVKSSAATSSKGKRQEEAEYEVEAILDDKVEDGIHLYFIKWKGYPSSANTWEPEAHLTSCDNKLEAYKNQSKPLPLSSPPSSSSSSPRRPRLVLVHSCRAWPLKLMLRDVSLDSSLPS